MLITVQWMILFFGRVTLNRQKEKEANMQELTIKNTRNSLELFRLDDAVEVSVESGRGTETTYLNKEQAKAVIQFLRYFIETQ